MSNELSGRVQRIKPSPTLAVGARAEELIKAGKKIVNLSLGEPDFDTPNHIKEAAIKAIKSGLTKYTPVDGIRSLKQAVVDKFQRDNNLKYGLDQVIVSSGAKHSLFNLFQAVLNPGDEVIIPAPYWVSYPDMVLLCDANPVVVQTDLDHHFKMTPAQLEAAITPKTRLLIIGSPSNPTGIAYSAAELKALAAVLLKHPHVLVVSDDIYEQILWNQTPFSNILMACPELYDRCIVVNGVSKTYSMTGWRIGYAGGPAHIIAAMKKGQSQSTSNPSSIAQAAAEEAINGDQSCVQVMKTAFKERHDYIYSELQKIKGIRCLPSDGTFYIFPNIEGLLNNKITNDLQFCEFLLTHANIAVVPGSAFGSPGHIRICYTTSMGQLQQAVENLTQALPQLASKAGDNSEENIQAARA